MSKGDCSDSHLKGNRTMQLQDFSIKALFLLLTECKIYSGVKNRIY